MVFDSPQALKSVTVRLEALLTTVTVVPPNNDGLVTLFATMFPKLSVILNGPVLDPNDEMVSDQTLFAILTII
jgi:hypothetical protein